MDRIDIDRLYTQHGKKMAQGILSEINGEKALAYFEGRKIVGYTTMNEINRSSIRETCQNSNWIFEYNDVVAGGV